MVQLLQKCKCRFTWWGSEPWCEGGVTRVSEGDVRVQSGEDGGAGAGVGATIWRNVGSLVSGQPVVPGARLPGRWWKFSPQKMLERPGWMLGDNMRCGVWSHLLKEISGFDMYIYWNWEYSYSYCITLFVGRIFQKKTLKEIQKF